MMQGFAFTPAPQGSGRLYDLRVVTKTTGIPAHEAVATDDWPDLVQNTEAEAIVVLIKGPGAALVLFRNLPGDAAAFARVQARLRLRRMVITDVCEAPPQILGAFRGRRGTDRSTAKIELTQSDTQRLFYDIVGQAYALRASDIHLFVDTQYANVSLRVHGELRSIMALSRDMAEALSRTIFALADPDSKPVAFSERAAQPAAVECKFTYKDKLLHVKLRYASIPVAGGWDLALRLLPIGQDGDARTLGVLGYDEPQLHDFGRMLSRPKGMILLCGPTGSGKSTTIATLCGMLYDYYEGRRLIRSIEDPVEYYMRGVRQTSVVRRDHGEDEAAFSNMLIAAMRGDPDILMFGEVRDEISARTAKQAVQTGHKLLTTLHTGDPFEAYDRLMDLGVERTVISGNDFISGIIHQRLLPIVCPHCQRDWAQAKGDLPQDLARRLHATCGNTLDTVRFRGPGCEACGSQGHSGRTVAAAILIPDREIQDAILNGNRLRAEACWRASLGAAPKGPHAPRTIGRTSLDQAIAKMKAGLICPTDVERAFGFLDDQRTPEQEREWLKREATRG